MNIQNFIKINKKGLIFTLFWAVFYAAVAMGGILVKSDFGVFQILFQVLLSIFGLSIAAVILFSNSYSLGVESIMPMMWLKRSSRLGCVLRFMLLILIVWIGLILLSVDLGAAMLRYHWIILSIVSVFIVFVLFLGLAFGGDIEEFLDGFKTFPMLSPFICFTAPAAWRDTFMKFGIADGGIRITSILLFCAGGFFVTSMIFLWIAKAHKKHPATSSGLLGPDGYPLPSPTRKETLYFHISLSFLILAM